MNRIKILIGTLLISGLTIGQQNPTGTQGTSPDWKRGGNVLGGGNPPNANIFGTKWNSPIYTQTNGANRMKLNGTFGVPGAPQYPINGYLGGVNTSGYLLLGNDNITQQSQPSLYNSKGAFSLLHLNGTQNSGGGGFTQEFGYRPWMQTGITFTGNNDLMYLGVRRLEGGQDRSELGLTWSDNSGNTFPGPDDFVFRFTSAGGGTTAYSGNYDNETDIDGRHVARFTGTGDLGLGPVFGVTTAGSPAYFRPQSRQHTANPGTQEVWHQQTNINGTGMTADDGLRLGITRNPQTTQTNGYLRWQENTPFIVQTDWDNTSGGIQNGERMRISSTAAPGVPAAPFANNITRVSINYEGGAPISQPRALLHLGYNNNTTSVANWMDFGTLVATSNRSIFTGITLPNYTDPLQSAIGFGGSNLVFIEANDVEVGRFDGATNNFGIGDFSPTGLIAGAPTQRLDVEGNGRFRDVPANGGQSIILGIEQNGNPDDVVLSRLEFTNDPNDVLLGDGTWGTVNNQTNVTADNGLTINPIVNNVQLGQINSGVGALNGGELIRDTEIPTNGFNIFLPSNGTAGQDQLIFGNSVVTIPLLPDAKHQVWNEFEKVGSSSVTVPNGFGPNDEPIGFVGLVSNNQSQYATGVYGVVQSDPNSIIPFETRGVYGVNFAIGQKVAIGVQGLATSQITHQGAMYGGVFDGKNGFSNLGVEGRASNADPMGANTGGKFTAVGTNNINYGVQAIANQGNFNYAVYGSTFSGGNSYAGYFAGDVFVTGMATVQGSDINLKENINTLENSLDIIEQLNPTSFNYQTNNYPSMNLPQGLQYGLIAQEVALVLPDIVKQGHHPEALDSLGNIVHAAVDYMGIKYDALIPVLIGGIKEQQTIITSQDSVITNLNDRLTSLENCLSGILPFLCQLSNTAIQENDEETQNNIVKELQVVLNDAQNIVLGQNVPNPFAEQTAIEYFIPEAVQKAQIIFYNLQGQIIQSVDITEMGNGKLNVYGNDLSSGTYTYTLVADGKVIATKKMVKTH